MRIVILGAPGTGKRAQTRMLAEKYGLRTLTTGELVKSAMADEGGYGPQLRMLHQAGQPVTDDLLLNLLQDRLQKPDMRDGFVLNGFPRNLLQALTLDESLVELGQPLDIVLLIHIETDSLMERLVGRRTCRSCGAVFNIYTHPSVVEGICDHCGGRLHQRADDNEETVSSRLHVFDHLTSALLDHYGKQGKMLRVDGDGPAEKVFVQAEKVIEGFLNHRAEGEPPERETEPDLPSKTVTGTSAGEGVSETGSEEVRVISSEVNRKTGDKKKPSSQARSQAKKSGTKKKAATKPLKPKRVTGKKKPSAKKKPAVKKAAVASLSSKKKRVKPKTSSKKKVVQKKSTGKKKVSKRAVVKKRLAGGSVKKKATTNKRAAAGKSATAKKKKVAASKKKVATRSTVKLKKTVPAKKVSKKKGVQPKRVAKKVVKKKAAKKKVTKKTAAVKTTPKVKKKTASRKKVAKTAKRTIRRR
ncbi:MAG: nucleoside monophosphate kinase [Candidatus Thiodiazotropha sp. (ex Monitilora ramsayi)]|nr:nucleoside monophosphate kinase [Candidatus Thiodiazotropha sp. (ex Monitilora ramsayi)]